MPEPDIDMAIKVTNRYPRIGRVFHRILVVTAPRPAAGSDLNEWAQEYLIPHTGEGPDYADEPGEYTVEVLTGSSGRIDIDGLICTTEG